MKKLVFFVMAMLIFASPLANNAYAQNDPDILIRIATQADKQIHYQLLTVYGDSPPDDIHDLYQRGHLAVESLQNSTDDIEQAREDFLLAMKSFKQITRIIFESVRITESVSDESYAPDLQSELNRLYKYSQNLKTISEKHKAGIDFLEVEKLFEQARQLINSNNLIMAAEIIRQLDSLIDMIKENLHQHASDSAPDRAREFALNYLEDIKVTLEHAAYVDSTIVQLDEAYSLIEEIEILIYQDNISDAKQALLKLITLVKMIETSIN